MAEVNNSSSDGYYFLSLTQPIHLPGLISTNPQDSPHMPMPQKAIPPEVPGFTDIAPERVGADFGMETSFKYIPNDQEVWRVGFAKKILTTTTTGAEGRYRLLLALWPQCGPGRNQPTLPQ